jgi:hypothetical protein
MEPVGAIVGFDEALTDGLSVPVGEPLFMSIMEGTPLFQARGCVVGSLDATAMGNVLGCMLMESVGAMDGDSVEIVGLDEVSVNGLSVLVGEPLFMLITVGTPLSEALGCVVGSLDATAMGDVLGWVLMGSVGATDGVSVEIVGFDEALTDGLLVPVGEPLFMFITVGTPLSEALGCVVGSLDATAMGDVLG